MSEHQPSCVRSQFWDAGEYDAPCTCDTKEQEAGVTDGLIARLKAAHEAATPGPLRVKREIGGYEWVFDARDEVVMEGESGDLALYVLVRNALPEIIAALEERERMRAVVDAARQFLLDTDPLSFCDNWQMAPNFRPCWGCPGCRLRAALDALDEKP